MKRVDADDFGVAPPGPLFAAAADGPFAASKIEASAEERVIAEMIWRHKGRANPISIAKIAAATGKKDREIKAIVAELVVSHGMKIGGSRMEPVGYFLVVDAEDLEAAIRPYRDQVMAMWRRLRALADSRTLRELHGQLAIEE